MWQNLFRFSQSIMVSVFAIFICFGILDALWLGWIAQGWYQTEMNSLLRSQFITWPWLVFYVTYGGVVFVLAVVANRDKPFYYAAIDGGLLGLASYGAYNLTNYSIIEGFSLFIMMIDWVWGIFLTSASAVSGWLGFQLMRKSQSSNA
ncbi:DUF2177 family protein [Alteromonas gilva]|uniref:DUF2177 family protein n=1 Tax=Alteromonas gilva TaxID=2987522 RepID=A0ABT5KYH4_9ALTE|nr:DUF2177 family protein [Alteromonas gilva]MDC8829825.1 DUF2177 family protein [Alteromonas gilva]